MERGGLKEKLGFVDTLTAENDACGPGEMYSVSPDGDQKGFLPGPIS